MSTTGHLNEAIDVKGLKASLQKLKTDHIDGKADEATTLAGYGITDAYTKTEVNGLVDTPHQNYVTVAATSQTTAATDVLPASGQAADTIYRVSNWDGSTNSGAGAFDATCYSEYAWDDVSNPNKYVFLCVKSQIGEVFDITAYNSNTKYANLAAALGVDGANVPSTLRKGGMSVKYVQTSDNKYVQFRLMSQTFSNDETDWQGVDDEPTAGSDNLVKSGGISKRLFKGMFVGNNNTFSQCPVDALIPGYTYRVYIHTPLWDMTGVTIEDGVGFLFAVYNVYNGEQTNLLNCSCRANRKPYYDFTIPTNSDGVIIGGRATENVKVYFEISNITEIENTKDSILKLRNNVKYGDEGNTVENARLNADTHEPQQPYQGVSYTADYIPVKKNDSILWVFGIKDNTSSLFVYDANKEFIRYFTANTDAGQRTIVIQDDNAAFIRASFRSDIECPITVTNIGISVKWVKIVPLVGFDTLVKKIESYDTIFNNIAPISVPANTTIALKKENMHIGSLQGDARGTVAPEFRNCLYSDYIKIPVLGQTNLTFTLGQKEIGGELYNVMVRVQARDNNKEPTPADSHGYLPYQGYGVPQSPVKISNPAYTYMRIGCVYRKASDNTDYPVAIDVYEDGDVRFSLNQDMIDYVTDKLQGEINDLDNRVVDLEHTSGKINYSAIQQISRPVYRSNVKQADRLVLEWISDLHYDLTALKEYINIKSLSNDIADIFHSGDLIGHYWSNVGQGDAYSISQYLNVAGAANILLAVGNHDAWEDNYNVMSAHDDVYDRLMANQINNWGVVHSGKNLYWYKDYTAYGIRLISLDCMYWESTQKTWFEDVLADARTNNLQVVVSSHYIAGDMNLWDCSFTSIKDTPGEIMNIQAPACVDSFIQAGGVFICWLCGHSHRDYVGVLESYPEQVVIDITCANNGDYNQTVYCDSLRYNNPYVKYAANLISFDTYNKRITVLRLGDNYDQYLRHRESMCIDYGNSTKGLIYCS